MTKRQTRAFFLGSTGVFSLIFLALTIDSHRQFPTLTHSDQITPSVIAGKHVWHRKNCINCHTLLGEGAYYAPDLTKIAEQRGAP
ncbi:MAG: c-type cytochrome, partial [Gemmatimonadota bacterium]